MIDFLWSAVVFFIAFVMIVVLKPGQSPVKTSSFQSKVTYVFDGDTVQIDLNERRVRLWGVDAPEIGRTGAKAATKALNRLVFNKRVTVVPVDEDRYGRLVARLVLKDGRDVGGILISHGYAREYYRYSKGYYSER